MDVDRSSDSEKSDENSDSNEEFENAFTRPVQVDFLYKNDKQHDLESLQNTFEMRDNDNEINEEELLEEEITTRGIENSTTHYTEETVIHCDAINFETISSIAGTNNLGAIRNFTFRVRCPGPQDTIQRLPRLMPFITALYLDNSSFYNFRYSMKTKLSFMAYCLYLRIFGEEISSLKVVSAMNCGISDISGVDFLINLKELYVSNNCIDSVFELSDLQNIEIADFEDNKLDDFDSVSFLYLSPKIHTITFRGNPIAEHPEYEERIKRYLPRLQNLDPVKLKSIVVAENCQPSHQESSSEDDSFTDIQMRIPEPDLETEEEEEEKIEETKDDVEEEQEESSLCEEIKTIECFKKFKDTEDKLQLMDCEESGTLFADIEKDNQKDDNEEEEKTQPLKFIHSSKSCEWTQDAGESSSEDGRTFCCNKHRTIFTQSANSIRLSASKQLYEQVSCEDNSEGDGPPVVKVAEVVSPSPSHGKDSGFYDPGSDADEANALVASNK